MDSQYSSGTNSHNTITKKKMVNNSNLSFLYKAPFLIIRIEFKLAIRIKLYLNPKIRLSYLMSLILVTLRNGNLNIPLNEQFLYIFMYKILISETTLTIFIKFSMNGSSEAINIDLAKILF